MRNSTVPLEDRINIVVEDLEQAGTEHGRLKDEQNDMDAVKAVLYKVAAQHSLLGLGGEVEERTFVYRMLKLFYGRVEREWWKYGSLDSSLMRLKHGQIFLKVRKRHEPRFRDYPSLKLLLCNDSTLFLTSPELLLEIIQQ